MVEVPQHYHAGRRTLNHVIARAAREGRIFTRDPRDADAFRHDGNVSNEWELVTLDRLQGASEEARDLDICAVTGSINLVADRLCPARAKRSLAALELGSGPPVHPGRHLVTVQSW